MKHTHLGGHCHGGAGCGEKVCLCRSCGWAGECNEDVCEGLIDVCAGYVMNEVTARHTPGNLLAYALDATEGVGVDAE